MKTITIAWARPSFLIILCAFFINPIFAQSTKKEKQAKKQAEIKAMVEAKNYTFIAEYAQPMRGGNRYITPDYDFKVTKDTLTAYLPYFGRAYVAPMNPDDAGMKFTSIHFDYKMLEKKDSWDITIKPKDAKDVQTIQLNITKDGYATLRIASNNRDAISYQGYIQQVKKRK
jgi:hypothetical protein